MKLIKDGILDLLNTSNKDEIANKLSNLLDNYKEFITLELYKEYNFEDSDTGADLGGSCFITPPSKGEYYELPKGLYEVTQVIHVFHYNQGPGRILMKKVQQ